MQTKIITLWLGLIFLLAYLFGWISSSQATPQKQHKILILGDSLTEGFGLNPEEAYPALLEKALKAKGYQVKVINAGIGGSTSASALSRLKWHLKAKPVPTVLFLALGPNDGMRGVKLTQVKANLSAVIALAQKQKIQVILAGMKLPPNYGKAYTQDFEKLYQDLAQTHQVPLIPFLLKGVAAKPELNLPDGIHPNAKGQRVISQTVLPYLEKVLKP